MSDIKGSSNHGADADMGSGSEYEIHLTSDQEQALLEDDGQMDTSSTKNPVPNHDKGPKLSGSQIRRRAKCRILVSQGKIEGYEIQERKVVPIPKAGNSVEDAEKLISSRLPAKHQDAKASTSTVSGTELQGKRQRAEKDTDRKVWSKKARNEPPKSSPHAVVISYDDNYNAKIALHAYHSFQQDLAKKLREALLMPLSPVYQSERAVLMKNGRILVNCHNEMTRIFVQQVVDAFKWEGPEGLKSFKAWKAEEALEGAGSIKVSTRIFGPRRSFSEFKTILQKQNPGLIVSGWMDLNNGNPQDGNDYSQSHIIYIGIDASSMEQLKKNFNSLFYLDRVNYFRAFISKKTGENVSEEVDGQEGDIDKQTS